MGDFQRVLTPAQLTKHYELIQFLSQHPDQTYTLAQLDTLLPHGVAVQRFPDEWFDLIEGGACWHRSIELHRPAASSPTTAEAAPAPSSAARRAAYVLSCVKARINTLDELRSRLESPSTMLDADGCVALHTEQVILAPELLVRAQRTGLAYYFPDQYDKNEFRSFGLREASAAAAGANSSASAIGGSGGSGATVQGRATAALLDAFASQEDKSGQQRGGGAGGLRDRVYVVLPPGVRVQHQLVTRRGVAEQEDYAVPTRLYVGERLRLVFDNIVAVRTLQQPNDLQVQLTMAGVKTNKSDRGGAPSGPSDLLATEPPPPLRIRKVSQEVRHAPTANLSLREDGRGGSDGRPASNPVSAAAAATPTAAAAMAPPSALPAKTTTVKVEIEPLFACTLTLLLTVNGVENVLAVEVLDDTRAMPGVLILRDRQLESFALPQRELLADPLVNPPAETHYPYDAVLSGAQTSSSSLTGGATAPAQAAALQAQPWSEMVPLPWVQNPSPLLLSLREMTYPTQHATVQAATRAVFSAQSLSDEARLRQAKERLRREAAQRESFSANGKRRRRVRFQEKMLLSNRHLLHFGLDFSIPFTRPLTQ